MSSFRLPDVPDEFVGDGGGHFDGSACEFPQAHDEASAVRIPEKFNVGRREIDVHGHTVVICAGDGNTERRSAALMVCRIYASACACDGVAQ